MDQDHYQYSSLKKWFVGTLIFFLIAMIFGVFALCYIRKSKNNFSSNDIELDAMKQQTNTEQALVDNNEEEPKIKNQIPIVSLPMEQNTSPVKEISIKEEESLDQTVMLKVNDNGSKMSNRNSLNLSGPQEPEDEEVKPD